jgi:hypothetical protein
MREPGDPLDIYRLHDVPVPGGPVEPLRREQIMVVDPDILMLTMGGVWLENYLDAEKAYPGLIKAESLRKARQRRGVGTFPYRDSLKGESRLLVVRYQRKGKGCKTARAAFLPGIDPKAWLEKKLGELTFVRIEGGVDG